MVDAVENEDGWECSECGGVWDTEEEADSCCHEEIENEEGL